MRLQSFLLSTLITFLFTNAVAQSQSPSTSVVTWSGIHPNGQTFGSGGGNIAIRDHLGNRNVTLTGGWQWLGVPTEAVDTGHNRLRYQSILQDLASRIIANSTNNSSAPVMFEMEIGVHSVNVNTSDLASGVYIYRIKTDLSSVHNRFTVLK
ncbi:MAG: hypothetical protein JNN12_17590 [Bacteroidetes Order II. Incertae sedis bacterium]|nr:hypothetical protein [Bacteroidetes Order II. bacterium]